MSFKENEYRTDKERRKTDWRPRGLSQVLGFREERSKAVRPDSRPRFKPEL
jgi:hypothetical protein